MDIFSLNSILSMWHLLIGIELHILNPNLHQTLNEIETNQIEKLPLVEIESWTLGLWDLLCITSNYRKFGCPIICTDTNSQCYFFH